jgi:hypothetical protein
LGFHDQRFLPWAFCGRREHDAWKVQIAVPVGSPPPASLTPHGRSLAGDRALSRRFPPSWSADETEACFIVRDQNRQVLAYVYYEEEPGRRAAANLLTRDEARRIAANIAKLPEGWYGRIK